MCGNRPQLDLDRDDTERRFARACRPAGSHGSLTVSPSDTAVDRRVRIGQDGRSSQRRGHRPQPNRAHGAVPPDRQIARIGNKWLPPLTFASCGHAVLGCLAGFGLKTDGSVLMKSRQPCSQVVVFDDRVGGPERDREGKLQGPWETSGAVPGLACTFRLASAVWASCKARPAGVWLPSRWAR